MSCPAVERLSIQVKSPSLPFLVIKAPTTAIKDYTLLPCLQKLEIICCLDSSFRHLFGAISSSLITHLNLRCAHFDCKSAERPGLEDLPSMFPNLEELYIRTATLNSQREVSSDRLLQVLPRWINLKRIWLAFKVQESEEEKQLVQFLDGELKKKSSSSIQIKLYFFESSNCIIDSFNHDKDSEEEEYEEEEDEESSVHQIVMKTAVLNIMMVLILTTVSIGSSSTFLF